MLDKIGIGIATKDRWDDLALTLQKLEEFGLGGNETIVMDDGSREPVSAALRARFPRVRFERSEKSVFVARQRNRLAGLLSAPYFLQVDNDSFPVQGDLAGAVAWMEAHDDAFALAFVVVECNDFTAKLRALPAAPFRCHYFVGCGALIHRGKFLELEGYEESLEIYSEEVGVALHARSRDLYVYQYPGVVVRHNRSPVVRDHSQRAFLVTRNELVIANLYYPLLYLLVRWPSFVFKSLVFKWAPPAPPAPRSAVLRGVVAAIRLTPKTWAMRKAVAMGAFLKWKRLPSPTTIQ